MPHVPKRLPTTLRIQTALSGVSPDGHPCGLAQRPKGPGPGYADLDPPYAILYPLWQTLDGPPFGGMRHADAWWTYQVSLFALRGDQLEVMRDKVVEVIFGKTESGDEWATSLDTAGVKIVDREDSDDTGGEEPVAGVFPSSLRFRIKATPDT